MTLSLTVSRHGISSFARMSYKTPIGICLHDEGIFYCLTPSETHCLPGCPEKVSGCNEAHCNLMPSSGGKGQMFKHSMSEVCWAPCMSCLVERTRVRECVCTQTRECARQGEGHPAQGCELRTGL